MATLANSVKHYSRDRELEREKSSGGLDQSYSVVKVPGKPSMGMTRDVRFMDLKGGEAVQGLALHAVAYASRERMSEHGSPF